MRTGHPHAARTSEFRAVASSEPRNIDLAFEISARLTLQRYFDDCTNITRAMLPITPFSAAFLRVHRIKSEGKTMYLEGESCSNGAWRNSKVYNRAHCCSRFRHNDATTSEVSESSFIESSFRFFNIKRSRNVGEYFATFLDHNLSRENTSVISTFVTPERNPISEHFMNTQTRARACINAQNCFLSFSYFMYKNMVSDDRCAIYRKTASNIVGKI